MSEPTEHHDDLFEALKKAFPHYWPDTPAPEEPEEPRLEALEALGKQLEDAVTLNQELKRRIDKMSDESEGLRYLLARKDNLLRSLKESMEAGQLLISADLDKRAK